MLEGVGARTPMPGGAGQALGRHHHTGRPNEAPSVAFSEAGCVEIQLLFLWLRVRLGCSPPPGVPATDSCRGFPVSERDQPGSAHESFPDFS